MAVSIVGTPSVTTFVAVSSGNANYPATVNSGELLTLDFSQAFDVGITTPSGWTPIIAAGDGFSSTRGASFYRIADGSEGASLALTFGGSCDAVAIITRHSGFDSTTPINGTPATNTATAGSTTAIDTPSVTTSVNNCLVRRIAETRQSSGIGVPGGQTDGGTGTTGASNTNSTVRVGYSTLTSAGASGVVSFVSTGTDREWVGLTYAIAPSPGPTITGQPSDQTVNNGATATFSVTATGTAPITYQWQDNSSGSFADIGGATSSSYSPTAAYSMQDRQYRCNVSDAAGGPVTSSTATLKVAFNLSGTGPRSISRLGHPFGAGTFESYIRGTASSSGSTGTLARTNANDTLSSSGTTTVTGSLNRTNANDTSNASGTTAVVGTLSRTNNNDTSSASGNPVAAGSLSRTNANDTLTANGSVGGTVQGTLAYTNNNDTSTGAGNTTLLATLSKTNNNDTSSGSGSPISNGSLTRTNNNDTSTGQGTTTIQGTSSTTNANDILAASGTAGSTPVGTLTVVNINDTSSAAGTTIVQGTLGRTNNNDNLAASGTAGTPSAGNTTKLPMTGVGA